MGRSTYKLTILLAIVSGTVLIDGHVLRADEVVAREQFNYSTGASIAGQDGGFGWGTPWSGGDYSAVSPGLTYPNMSNAGNALGGGTSGVFVSRPLSAPVTDANYDSVFMMALINLSSNGTPTSYGAFGNLFGGGSFAIGDLPQTDPLAGNWGMQTSNGNFYSNVPVVGGMRTLLAARVDFSAGNDRMRMWVDPTINGALALSDISDSLDSMTAAIDVTSANQTAFSGMWFQDHTHSSVAFDEILITASPIITVPEPANLLFACACSAMFAIRRKRR